MVRWSSRHRCPLARPALAYDDPVRNRRTCDAVVSQRASLLMESVMAIPARVLTRSTSTSVLAVAIFVVALTSVSLAQTIRSTLTGTVTDPNNAVVANATVTATHVATNIESTTKTNDEGLYTFTALAPGEYVIAIAQTGFKRAQR